MTEQVPSSPDPFGFPAKEARAFVLAVVRRKLGYADPDVEDIAQETLFLLARWAQDHVIENWRALASTIAERQVASEIRHRQRRRPLIQQEGDQFAQAPGRADEMYGWILALVGDYFAKEMPECLPLFIRHGNEGVSFEDLAKEMGVTPESLRQRWHRCRKHVQGVYGDTVALTLDRYWRRRLDGRNG